MPALEAPRPARPRRRLLIGGSAAAIAAAAVVIIVTRGGDAPRVERVVSIDAGVARVVAKAQPPKLPPNSYIGSARCAECHEKEHAAWKKSWHAKALAPAVRGSVAGTFANTHFTGTSSEAWMKRVGTKYAMRAMGIDRSFADYPIEWVIGGKRMQDDITVLPDGRWQVLPVYFHVTGKQWVDYTEAKQGPLTPEHEFFWTNWRRMANHECLDCHVTALRVTYDESDRKWTTSFVDPGVACEDCHGPGARHAETQEKEDIVHPVDAREVGQSACARCHGPRNPLFPLLDPAHQFQLGQSYDELYDPIVVAIGDGMSPEFFADGRPKTSSFEYQALLQSACYRKGQATCLTCHDAPHAAKEHAELRHHDPDAPCMKCHSSIDRASHSHHKTAAAQKCVACHMSAVVSGVLDHFADHTIDIPVPQNTTKHEVPNACGVCHRDRSADKLAEQLAAWWPDAQVRAARRLRLADAFDSATARQSARALLAVITDEDEAPTLRGAAMLVAAARFKQQTARPLQAQLASKSIILRAKACEALAIAKATNAGDALATHLDDPSLRVRLACALALYDLGDRRGEPALAKLASDPDSDHLLTPHLEVGLAHARRNDFAVAEAELTKVARLSPYFADPIVQLAAVLADEHKFDEARKRLDQALALEPYHKGAAVLLNKLPAK